MPDELDPKHPPMAPASGGGETPPALAGHSPGCGPEHGLRAGAGGHSPPARDTRPDRATRFVETTRGILSYSELGDLTLELLAFAEGRFLSIHPFPDFNGRTIRLFLLELLRRLDLPRVTLAPESETERELYFRALEAADQLDWQPLVRLWQQRFVAASPNPPNQP
jgi:hypothetical protein